MIEAGPVERSRGRLLCPSHKWPRGRRAVEKRQELLHVCLMPVHRPTWPTATFKLGQVARCRNLAVNSGCRMTTRFARAIDLAAQNDSLVFWETGQRHQSRRGPQTGSRLYPHEGIHPDSRCSCTACARCHRPHDERSSRSCRGIRITYARSDRAAAISALDDLLRASLAGPEYRIHGIVPGDRRQAAAGQFPAGPNCRDRSAHDVLR